VDAAVVLPLLNWQNRPLELAHPRDAKVMLATASARGNAMREILIMQRENQLQLL
jgi:hypothetical protein